MTIKELKHIVSYKTSRLLIGLVGILLPIILPIGHFLFGNSPAIQDSISHYYCTEMRDVFVGSMFVLGFFLFSYIGFGNDHIIATIGGIFALAYCFIPYLWTLIFQ